MFTVVIRLVSLAQLTREGCRKIVMVTQTEIRHSEEEVDCMSGVNERTNMSLMAGYTLEVRQTNGSLSWQRVTDGFSKKIH